MPALWCEARCAFFVAGSGSDGRNACAETAPGAFGSVHGARSARSAGWSVVDGKWCCPACRRVLDVRRQAVAPNSTR